MSALPTRVPPEEIARQREFARRASELLRDRFGETPLAFVHSYGCQQNVADGERISGMLAEMGFGFTDEPEKADLILFNTCAVRGHAEDRVLGNVGALKGLKRARPGVILGLCGCMVQQESVADRIRQHFPFVDLLFGTHVIHCLPELLCRLLEGGKRVFERPDAAGVIAEGLPVRRDSVFKGWLPVMYGCNNFCTYCIVPYVRGRERSRDPGDVLREARAMVAAGFKDITLLGQNVNSYGRGADHGVDFAGLLRRVNDIEGDFRIRFMTSHPRDCTLDLLDAMRDCEKVCGHLHLPFQSGSDRVLKAMNRHYDRARYLELIAAARERMPGISLTSDVIVGFPGETREDFEQTLSLIREVKFTSLFTFIYSPREGTPAARMPDPVSHEEKTRWMAELLAAQEAVAAERTAATIGRTFRVLCEESHDDGTLFGRTDGNVGIVFDGGKEAVGQFLDVRVTDAKHWILTGEIVAPQTK